MVPYQTWTYPERPRHDPPALMGGISRAAYARGRTRGRAAFVEMPAEKRLAWSHLPPNPPVARLGHRHRGRRDGRHGAGVGMARHGARRTIRRFSDTTRAARRATLVPKKAPR